MLSDQRGARSIGALGALQMALCTWRAPSDMISVLPVPPPGAELGQSLPTRTCPTSREPSADVCLSVFVQTFEVGERQQQQQQQPVDSSNGDGCEW